MFLNCRLPIHPPSRHLKILSDGSDPITARGYLLTSIVLQKLSVVHVHISVLYSVLHCTIRPLIHLPSDGVKISKLGIPWPLILVESNISIKQISISNLLQNIRNTRTLHSLYGYSYTIHAMLQYHITSLCIYVIFQIAYWHFTWYSKRDESTSIYKFPWSLMPTSTLFCYKYLTLDFSFILIH